MRHPALRRFVLARASVAVLVVLTLTACGGNNNAPLPSAPAPSVSTAPVDPAVKVSGLPTGTQATVTDTSVGVENGDNLDFVSPVYTLAPAGPVGHAVTVQIQLDNALPTTTPLVIASRASANGPWAYAPGRLTPDQRHVEFRATSLNQVGVLSINLDGALASFQTARTATRLLRPRRRPSSGASAWRTTSGSSRSRTGCSSRSRSPIPRWPSSGRCPRSAPPMLPTPVSSDPRTRS